MEEKIKRSPKILVIDIETSPHKGSFWGNTYETSIIEVEEFGQIIGYSAKWLNGKQITKALIDYAGYKPGKINDKNLVKDVRGLLDEADIVVTQNGVDFDTKYLNTRFIAHNLNPPSPYKQIDTKREARKIMRLPSNKLDNLARYFNLGHKLEHEGYDLWKKCISGDRKAWNKMKRYNAHDVELTEKVYLKLRPFMKSHPNIGIYLLQDKEACNKCGSDHVQSRGYARNNTTMYKRFQCQDCGSWYRGNKSIKLEKKPGVNI